MLDSNEEKGVLQTLLKDNYCRFQIHIDGPNWFFIIQFSILLSDKLNK